MVVFCFHFYFLLCALLRSFLEINTAVFAYEIFKALLKLTLQFKTHDHISAQQ